MTLDLINYYIYKSNGGRTTETRQAGKQEDTTPKRGSYLPNYFDRTQTKARKFGLEEEGESHQEDVHGPRWEKCFLVFFSDPKTRVF